MEVSKDLEEVANRRLEVLDSVTALSTIMVVPQDGNEPSVNFRIKKTSRGTLECFLEHKRAVFERSLVLGSAGRDLLSRHSYR